MIENMIFHIDVNSAFLSWEAVRRLEYGEKTDLRDIPSIVGGDIKKRRGIVLAKSISAKKFGIKTGETIYSALKKCPFLTIVPPNHDFYQKASACFIDYLRARLPLVEQYSIDECFADVTSDKNITENPIHAADDLRKEISNKLGFTVNIGISENKLLAKMASEFEKPDKTHTLFKDEIKYKMWPLPIEELFMVGRKTAVELRQCGITTIGQLANYNKDALIRRFKYARGTMLYEYANGIDHSAVISNMPLPKSIGNSTTIASDIASEEDAFLVLLSLCETVGARLRKKNLVGSTISVSIKTNDFKYYSKQIKIPYATYITNAIYQYAKSIFSTIWNGEKIRHIGVSISDLNEDITRQNSFFDNNEWEKYTKMDNAIDNLRDIYGKDIIKRAGFLETNLSHMTGNKQDGNETGLRSHL